MSIVFEKYQDIIQVFSKLIEVKLMCSYCKKHKETEVPDLYYGGQQGFGKDAYVQHK
ncbi:hypothetical protein QJS10_CPB04g01604 [Acorus calamus]|uniref:Uncharacterized protein n=1 Tax=Acorus calamus TaxID=4465 RepID=A0AAV9F1N6_ACOCL|nr:hypothetical protein QJS10_CPB04g01604 [Acorus calamus]